MLCPLQGTGQRTVKCKCSFLEIYNETLTDLLSPAEGQHLQIREDASHGIYVENLCEEAASGSECPCLCVSNLANQADEQGLKRPMQVREVASHGINIRNLL